MPKPNHFGDEFWGILEVGIHNKTSITLSQVQSGGDGNLMSEITREVKDFYAPVALM